MPTVDIQRKSGLPSAPEDGNRAVLQVDSNDGQLKYNDGSATRTVSQGIFAKEIVLKFDDDGGAGEAGTYVGAVTIPAGAILLDIVVSNVALWNAGTSASLEVGNGGDPDGYFTAVDLKATDLLANESVSFALAGGVAGADIANSHVIDRYSASAQTITATVTAAGTAMTTGHTRITVLYALAQTADVVTGTFTAA